MLLRIIRFIFILIALIFASYAIAKFLLFVNIITTSASEYTGDADRERAETIITTDAENNVTGVIYKKSYEWDD